MVGPEGPTLCWLFGCVCPHDVMMFDSVSVFVFVLLTTNLMNRLEIFIFIADNWLL